jgi:hypothetical protein
MSREDVELVSRWVDLLPPGTDLKSVFVQDAFRVQARQILDPEAKIRFVDAEGGALGDLEVRSRGVEGLLEGWAEWLEAWDQFRVELEDFHDAGDGRVLTLATLIGQTHDGSEISQPAAALVRVGGQRIVSMDFYLDREQARREAGLD